MGDLMADLMADRKNPHVSAPKREAHPKGWVPGVEENGDSAVAVSVPVLADESRPTDEQLIVGWNMDPAEWEIVGEVNCRRWQTYDERWLHYYKANLSRRSKVSVDVEDLCSRIGRRRPRAPWKTAHTGGYGLVVAAADWQVGKGDGDGVQGTMDRLTEMTGKVEDRIDALGRMGVNIEVVYLCGMGDLGEACAGHYAQQAFRTQLNRRDQRKVIRWAIDGALDTWSRKVSRVEVHVVGGNHGENRQEGKSFTDFADNDDVAVFEDLAFAYSKNPSRYGNVSFFLPNDDLTLSFAHEGTIVALAHGHQAGFTTGGDPAKKIENWWKNQMFGMPDSPVGAADILITAHYHNPWMRRSSRRTHFGCPALDGGSDWFRNAAGADSPPGTLTFVLGPDGTGWSNMEIL